MRHACAAILFLSVELFAGDAPKDLEPVKAQLWHARDGLGNILTKLKAGKDVTIAYCGGSITANPNCWREKVTDWLRKTYPNSKITEINAAIGGTGSELCAFRYNDAVLKHKPDLVLFEYAVNDNLAAPELIFRAMEGCIRKTWTADPATDICFVYTLHMVMKETLEQGLCPRGMSAHDTLAAYHGIPSINVALRTVNLAREGKLLYAAPLDAAGKPTAAPTGKIIWANDDCHPIDGGHQVYADLIGEAFTAIAANLKPGAHTLKPPFNPKHYQDAKMVPIKPAMLSKNWRLSPKDDPMTKWAQYNMPEVWETFTPGDTLSFKFKGRVCQVFLLYSSDGGNIKITIDGKVQPPRALFNNYCTGGCLVSYLWLGDSFDDSTHSVTLELLPEIPDRSKVIDTVKNNPQFNPKYFEGTALRVGGIMLVGELAE